MGKAEKDQWMRTLPWTLMGIRHAFRPSLDASSAQLVFGKNLQIPGALLHKPGPDLTTKQTNKLLHQLYRMMDRPARPMAGKHEEKDISHTENVDQVYYRNHGDEKSLSEKFKGPVPINSRPSRSTLELKVGSYASGEPRLQEFSWSSCKPANYRDEAFSVFRDKLGRKRKSSAPSVPPGFHGPPGMDPSSVNTSPVATSSPAAASGPPKGPHSAPLSDCGPFIPNDLFEDLSPGVTSGFASPPSSTGRPVRTTRNKKPVRFRD